MTPTEAATIAGSLGFPSKMPGTSYGIPAQACITGAKLAMVGGSVCHDCYALKGRYGLPNVRKGLERRLAAIRDPRWVEAMVVLLSHAHAQPTIKWRFGEKEAGYHRWNDTGDLQDVAHLDKIIQIAERLPDIKFWLPTREAGMVLAYVKARGGAQYLPANLVIRVSATMVDDKPPRSWPLTSTVHEHKEPSGRSCPAPDQGNECRDCRACWSRDVANVSYHKH